MEWFCKTCRRWVNGGCCPGCLVISPEHVRWMSAAEIKWARDKVLRGQ